MGETRGARRPERDWNVSALVEEGGKEGGAAAAARQCLSLKTARCNASMKKHKIPSKLTGWKEAKGGYRSSSKAVLKQQHDASMKRIHETLEWW